MEPRDDGHQGSDGWMPPVLLGLFTALLVAVAGREWIEKLPPLLWVMVALYGLWLVRPYLSSLLGRIETFKGFGIELKLAGTALEKAVAERAPIAGFKATPEFLAELRKAVAGREILWIDDNPAGNRDEARALQYSGAIITFSANTGEALRALRASAAGVPFDLVISDHVRFVAAPPPTAAATARFEDNDIVPDWSVRFQDGRLLPALLRRDGFAMPVIFYVGEPIALPQAGFGITDRPDVLMRMVINALRR